MTNEFFQNNLHLPPDEANFHVHYFCDYIELIALTEGGEFFSDSSAYDRFKSNSHSIDDTEIEDFEKNEKLESRISDIFLLLESRANFYSEFYPFEIINKSKIRLKNNLENHHYGYLFLLLCSNQKYIKHNKTKLTNDFEIISKRAIESNLPLHAQTHMFGKSGIENSEYKGHITKKLDKLAEELGITTKYEERFFAPGNNGDGGLDIISWVFFPKDDNKLRSLLMVSQCATGKDWVNKQSDTMKLGNYLNFSTKLLNSMVIPYDGRNGDGSFNQEADLICDILFDRRRILFSFDNWDFIKNIESYSLCIQKALEFTEDII